MVEMLIAVGISTVVVAELVVVLVGLFRLEKEKLWDAELVSRLRVARENLLFRALPTEGMKTYGGLLSASNFVWSSQRITAAFQYAKEDGTVGIDPNEDVSERFLVKSVDDGENEVLWPDSTNGILFVNTEVSLNIGKDASGNELTTNRAERIAVSVFGKGGTGKLWGDFMEWDPESDIDPPMVSEAED